ncbi:hypothetical protein LXL04_020368 [Taraxacum kok-saghyz]
MSMHKYAKQRVMAPSMFDIDTNATKKKGSNMLPHQELEFEHNGTTMGELILSKNIHGSKYVDTNVAKRNNLRATTMGQLILSKKGPNSSTSGARRKLLLDETDDDTDDFERSLDFEHATHEVNKKVQDTTDIRNLVLNVEDMEEDDSNGDETDDDMDDFERSLDFEHATHEVNRKVQETTDIRNIDMIVEGCDNEADYENEEDECVRIQSKSTHLEKDTVRKINEREIIICNESGQPTGPQTEENDIVGKFSHFLGTIARNYDYALLTYNSWHKVPDKEKEKMWEFVLTKYILPELDADKDWVLRSIGADWRGYKCSLKKKHSYQLKDNQTRWNNRPKNIPENDFLQLLNYWNKKEVMNQCLQNRNVRKDQKNMHTAGPKSFARISEEMELMKNYQPPENVNGPVDPIVAVMGKEYEGHCRLYGKGVSRKLLKMVNSGDTSYIVPGDLMESLKTSAEAAGKREIADMRKELEEDHERKQEHQRQKAKLRKKLEEEHQSELEAIRKDIDNKMKMLMDKMKHCT